MDLVTIKILVAVLFALTRFFFGVLPAKLYHLLRRWEEEDDSPNFVNEKRHKQVSCATSLCQSFGGGVLFATCFLHMMVEVYKSVEELKVYGIVLTDFPISQLTVCTGFFFVYFLEEISHWFLTKIPEEPQGNLKKNLGNRTITPILEQNNKKVFLVENGTKDQKPTTSRQSEDEEEEKSSEMKQLEKKIKKEEKSRQQIMRCCLIVVALSFHSIFEGLAIGLQTDPSTIWYLFTAICIHSSIILFCMGLELILAKAKLATIVVQMLILSATSPFGVVLGLLITLKSNMNTKAKSLAVVCLEGLSAGTILYITFFEVLNREKNKRAFRLYRGICIIAGFTFMVVLQYVQSYC